MTQEYYKKKWEESLAKNQEALNEAEYIGYKKAAMVLADYGMMEASFLLCSIMDDALQGKKSGKSFIVGKFMLEKERQNNE